jgi:hypothetical protein
MKNSTSKTGVIVAYNVPRLLPEDPDEAMVIVGAARNVQ